MVEQLIGVLEGLADGVHDGSVFDLFGEKALDFRKKPGEPPENSPKNLVNKPEGSGDKAPNAGQSSAHSSAIQRIFKRR
jgi:hypothetical protein